VTWFSNRVGQRPAIIGFSVLGIIMPLGAMVFAGRNWLLAGIFFIGWGLNDAFSLYMTTIPIQSVDPRLTATLTGV
jgi:cyanate permease